MVVLEVCAVAALVALLLVYIKVWHKLFAGQCTSKARMDGKTVIVTGADTGMGKETALELARRGACVIMTSMQRDLDQRGAQARDEIIRLSGNKDVHVLPLNLESLSSVRNFVQLVKQRTSKLHVLVNNAGVGMMPNLVSEDGLQITMHINHFGPMMLTLLLLDLLRVSAPSRIIMVSSHLHNFANLTQQNLNEWTGKLIMPYNNSKLGNILFSNELARRLRGTGVTCNSLHPGYVPTVIYDTVPCIVARFSFKFALKLSCKTPAEGAQTAIHLAVADEVSDISGKYFIDCKVDKMSQMAQDEEFAQIIWKESIRLLKLKPEEVPI